MTKISTTRIANALLNLFWFSVYGIKDIFSDIRRIAILVLCIITAVSISVSVWSLVFRVKEPAVIYNFIPEDVNAVPSVKDDRVELMYNTDILVDQNKVELLFGLPYDYKYDAVVTVKSQGIELAKSQRITAGKKIEKLDLQIGFDDMYVLQNTDAQMIIDFYDKVTGEMLANRIILDVFMSVQEVEPI